MQYEDKFIYNMYFVRIALKVMSTTLFCWPTMSEACVGEMAMEVEPSCQ